MSYDRVLYTQKRRKKKLLQRAKKKKSASLREIIFRSRRGWKKVIKEYANKTQSFREKKKKINYPNNSRRWFTLDLFFAVWIVNFPSHNWIPTENSFCHEPKKKKLGLENLKCFKGERQAIKYWLECVWNALRWGRGHMEICFFFLLLLSRETKILFHAHFLLFCCLCEYFWFSSVQFLAIPSLFFVCGFIIIIFFSAVVGMEALLRKENYYY